MITANELKTKGVGVIAERLVEGQEEVITVRGKNKYIVVDVERYEFLRMCEIEVAYQVAQKDIEKGDYTIETAEEHFERLIDEDSVD